MRGALPGRLGTGELGAFADPSDRAGVVVCPPRVLPNPYVPVEVCRCAARGIHETSRLLSHSPGGLRGILGPFLP